MYRIARYLPVEARRVAASCEYGPDRRTYGYPGHPGGAGRGTQYCPLGVALLGLVEYPTPCPTPRPATVAGALHPRVPHVAWASLMNAADEFIYDWDNGRIVDLHRALGVKPQMSRVT